MFFEIDSAETTEHRRMILKYLNPFCSKKCLTQLTEGKLQCSCGDIGIYEWCWDEQENNNIVVSKNHTEVVFHPVYSSGTAILRGTKQLKKNRHHYWEVKMMTNLYGTDVMVGVGTANIVLSDWKFRFASILGFDKQSWGYSYNGTIQHNKISRNYGSKFGLGSLIGVHLDMYNGKLEFYLNRKPLGLAFDGLKFHELYPMISSTAAQSIMKMTCAVSTQSTLQFKCLQSIIENRQIYEQFKSIPGLVRIYENKYFWCLPREEMDDPKRKSELENAIMGSDNKRRKIILSRLSNYRVNKSDYQQIRINIKEDAVTMTSSNVHENCSTITVQLLSSRTTSNRNLECGNSCDRESSKDNECVAGSSSNANAINDDNDDHKQ